MKQQIQAQTSLSTGRELGDCDQRAIFKTEQFGEGIQTEYPVSNAGKLDMTGEQAEYTFEQKHGYTKIVGKQTPQYEVVSFPQISRKKKIIIIITYFSNFRT